MSTNHVELYREFSKFLWQVRCFFVGQGLVETPTPTLVSCPGMEAHLDPIATSTGHFLPTSPEIHLKRLLCRGSGSIFEIRPCFRNDPNTDRHLLEFQMLEWYRTGKNLSGLVEDLNGLLSHLKAEGYWRHELTISEVSFRELFQRFFNFDFTAHTDVRALQRLFKERQIHHRTDESKVDLIHRLLIDFFEPSFRGLTILKDFPPEMAVLSQIGPDGFAERFELFFNSMELANAFHEVTAPEVQRERWRQDVEERRHQGVKALIPDEALLKDMETLGLPPCSGIALGLDRLFMAGMGLSNISEIRACWKV